MIAQKIYFRASLILLFSGVISLGLNAQYAATPESVGLSSERLLRLSNKMHEFVDEGQLSSVQTAIMRKGKLVHFDTYGYADLDSKTPLQDNSIWRIYSMTKPIVSVGLMMMYEEGKFNLNDPLHKYIPEFKDMTIHTSDGKVEPAKNPIRIVDILRHTSGLGYGWGGGYVDSLYAASVKRSTMTTTRDMSVRLSKLPLYYEPGTGWRYSLSTDVCGYLIEVLSGQPLDVYLNEKILEPLKMMDTHFEVPDEKDIRFVSNYTVNKEGNLTVIDHPSMSKFSKTVTHFSGGGGMVSTTSDYLKFCTMLLNGGELLGARIISPKTLELMTQDHCVGLQHQGGPVVLPAKGHGFGLGFTVNNDLAASGTLGSVGTYGWSGAAGTYFRVDPKEELVYVMMIQRMPHDQLQARERFHTLVYQAIID